MEKEFKVTGKQLQLAHNAACGMWKEKLEEWFPEAFNRSFEKGRWYLIKGSSSQSQDALVLFSALNEKGVGFNHAGNWTTSYGGSHTWRTTAIDITESDQLKEAIEKEAKKRGFPEAYLQSNGAVWTKEVGKGGHRLINHEGVWRVSDNYFTIEEAEKKFNIKIKK
jgi:hypothetical protein